MDQHNLSESDRAQPMHKHRERLVPSRGLTTGLLIAFLVAASITAYLAFRTVRTLILDSPFGGPSAFSPQGDEPQEILNPEGTPITVTSSAPIPGPTPQEWDGASRVNVLVMGLDFRDWSSGEGPPRTDTMIVFTIDPITNSAGMLSLPRDMWVDVPGFGHNKINQAYQLGESFRLPGGGPGLAVSTVEAFLGIPIHFYAQIDFSAFVRFIDEIGGVVIDVPAEMKIDLIGDGSQTIKTLESGIQTLPGDWALAYARARYTEGGDFDRAQRQQQVILAIRNRILQQWTNLLPKAPTLYDDIASGVKTNMTFDQALKLAWSARQIEPANIRRGIISTDHVVFGHSPEGLDILIPIMEDIRVLRDYIFTTSTAAGYQAIVGDDPLQLMLAEEARINVLNGANIPGLAGETAEYLRSLGVTIQDEDIGNYLPGVTYTTIIDFTGNPYTIQYLVDLMQIPNNNIWSRYDRDSAYDVEVRLGGDWALNNPMP